MIAEDIVNAHRDRVHELLLQSQQGAIIGVCNPKYQRVAPVGSNIVAGMLPRHLREQVGATPDHCSLA